jgi:hypothetical protein
MTQPNLGTIVCINHPDRETYLRCNRCNNPICSQCAVLTPTGYRCKDCIRGQQKVYETAQTIDPYLGALVALVLTFLGSFIVPVMQFFTLLIAPIVGTIIAEAVRRVVNRRRSRLLTQLVLVGTVVGGLPLLASSVLTLVARFALTGAPAVGLILPLVWQGLYIFLVAITVYRLGGTRL